MGNIINLQEKKPQIASSVWMAPTAYVIGEAEVGAHCSLWFNVIIRADVNKIIIGEETNLQDGVIVHCTYQKTETHIGSRVSVGHQAILHGCRIEDESMVGMAAVVMDNALVESGAMVAAGAVVTEGTVVKRGWIYAGCPAKPLKKLNEDQTLYLVKDTAKRYQEYSGWYRNL